MDDPTNDLIAFLRERLTEREERANADIDHFDDAGSPSPDPRDVWIVKTAREVLQDIAALRAALDECEEWGEAHDFVPALKRLAVRYADDGDYQERWGPA